MLHPIKHLLCGVLCAASVGLASAAGNNPIPDLTSASVTATTVPAQAEARYGVARGDVAGQPLLSFLSNDDDSDFSTDGTTDTPLAPASPRHVAALLLAGVTLVVYRTRNQRLPLRTAR